MKNLSLILSVILYTTCFLQGGCYVNRISDNAEGEIPANSTYLRRHLKVAAKKEVLLEGQLPSIFIIGAQKGGSMSLLDLMTQHPLLCRGTHREPHFFSIDENYEVGTKSYKNSFKEPKCGQNLKTSKYIDGTPMLHIDKVWERIVETYGEDVEKRDNLKFIALLREPVARDYVWYQHVVRNDLHRGQKFSNIKTLREMNLESNFTTSNGEDTRNGKYIDHIHKFLEHFRRDQLLVISSQAIFDESTTSSIMKRIYKFIGIPNETEVNQVVARPNHFLETGTAFETCAIHHIPEMDCSYRDLMGKYYEPYNQKLYAWLKSSKEDADINEPKFEPLFEDFKSQACIKNARGVYNEFLSKESETIALRSEFNTQTNTFKLPEGACRAPKAKKESSSAA